MEINITSRHMEVTDALKDYTKERLERLGKFNTDIMSARALLASEKFRHIAEMTVYVKNMRMTAKEEAGDIHSAVDKAFENMKQQLARNRDRAKKRKRTVAWAKLSRSVINIFTDTDQAKTKEPRIVSSNDFAPKPMLPRDAALELKVLNNNFIVFKNADTDQVNVMYKRKDGDFGLIEPDF